MMNYLKFQQEVYNFLSSLDINVYRNVAPQGAKLPYIVYDLETVEFGEQSIINYSVYSDSESYQELTDYVEKLKNLLPFKNGNLFLDKSNPFVQDKNEEDVKAILVSLLILANY